MKCGVVSLRRHNRQCLLFWSSSPTRLPSAYLSRDRLPPIFWLSFRLLCGPAFLSPPPHTKPHFPLIVPNTLITSVSRHAPTLKHVTLQTPCTCHYPYPSRPSTHKPCAVEGRDQPGCARRIRRMGHLRVPVRCVRRRSLGCPQHSSWRGVAGQTRIPCPCCLGSCS